MMINPAFADFETLPPDAQQQVIDFIAFIKLRYPSRKDAPDKPDVGRSFGAIKVKKRVTLEQMDEAIRQRGGEL
ncbi:MAG: hypothetical protein HZT40_11830 [Candidatus Thiothrix singaporensis]|uniref:DUF2281 domain-containing protein n=1 Tax=Candidatus Thiothrix singaporensis TaxID=2799669 RepID=A0A7L6ASY0_9GAMM|nr:MAG: hypothetical protein HZT40_11830 [Candidatus Thiothrix singaporensis]